MRRVALPLFALFASAWIAGCGGSASSGSGQPQDAGRAVTRSSEYRLDLKPAGAMAVTELRKTAQDGDQVVVTGRIGGGIDPWIEGRAAFILVDPVASATAAAGDGVCAEEDCSCLAEKLADAITVVKFVDGDGKTLETDARQLLGVKAMQNVVVKGTAQRIGEGNVSIRAQGIYVRR